MRKVVVVEWDGSSADPKDHKWVAREVRAPYPGEGFVFGVVYGPGSWIESKRLATWLNEREGINE